MILTVIKVCHFELRILPGFVSSSAVTSSTTSLYIHSQRKEHWISQRRGSLLINGFMSPTRVTGHPSAFNSGYPTPSLSILNNRQVFRRLNLMMTHFCGRRAPMILFRIIHSPFSFITFHSLCDNRNSVGKQELYRWTQENKADAHVYVIPRADGTAVT